MSGLYFLIPTILAIFLSMLIVRAGAIALMMTGMPLEKAKFQALSAFTGTGFTTREAESVVNHPRRRGIISWLMIFGHVGIVTVIITATTSLVQSQGTDLPALGFIALAGLLVIYLLAWRTGLFNRWERFVQSRLAKTAMFEDAPVDELLHLAEGYGLIKFRLDRDSPLCGSLLADSGIDQKHIIALGIERRDAWLPAPTPDTVLQAEDRCVIYGRLSDLREFGRDG